MNSYEFGHTYKLNCHFTRMIYKGVFILGIFRIGIHFFFLLYLQSFLFLRSIWPLLCYRNQNCTSCSNGTTANSILPPTNSCAVFQFSSIDSAFILAHVKIECICSVSMIAINQCIVWYRTCVGARPIIWFNQIEMSDFSNGFHPWIDIHAF